VSAPRVVVLGMMGRAPFAGVAWQVLHYLEGLARLGCEVRYVEDTGAWPYDPDRNAITDDPTFTTGYVDRTLGFLSEPVPWAYVGPERDVFGMSEAELLDALGGAAALINLTGATVLRDEHLQVPVRIYLETDPVLPQIEVANGRSFTIDLLAAHTHHFSYGERLGLPGCLAPVERFDYLPTRQPVVLDWWAPAETPTTAPPRPYTTIASWRQMGKDVEWQGETYTWSKHHEFLKFLDLPERTGREFELALAIDDPADEALLRAYGWRVVDGLGMSRDIGTYRDYLRASRGEFTVAKDQNVRLRTGWFSDRSACYLAAGLPVVTQDTGFGDVLPTGRGLFAFRTLDDAVAAIAEIEADYQTHAAAAAHLAAEHFDAEVVVGRMLATAGVALEGTPAR
jgi:hypothetical protein